MCVYVGHPSGCPLKYLEYGYTGNDSEIRPR